MERDESGDPNSFLKNYFRLVAGFTTAHGSARADDRLHDLSGFVQQSAGHNANSSLNCSVMKQPDGRPDFNAFASAAFLTDPHRHKALFTASASESPSMDYIVSAEPDPHPQRRHSMESTTVKTPAALSSFSHSTASSLFPTYLTAAQLCRLMWEDVKHRVLRCGICTKNISMTECSLILQHARSHCEFESFECLLCHGSTPNVAPYRTNKYQVMYGHMKSAHRGRMIMNETWRRLTPVEIAKIDEQLVANASMRSSIHDDPEEDRKVRDIIYQCFGEWINTDRLWEKISTVLTDEAAVGDRRENGNYYYLNDKSSFGSYRGSTTLALPLASASYGASGTSDALLQSNNARGQSPSFPFSRHTASQYVQRQPASVTMPIRRTSAEEVELRHNFLKEDRSVLDNLLKIQQSRKSVGQADLFEYGAVGYDKQITTSPAPPPAFYARPNRARKRVSGGSRSLPALETINQLCQQLRNEASYYDGEQRGAAGQEGSSSAVERRPRIWCHLCNKAIELPEAASRYMTEHVASAHTTLKLFCCATCPYEAKTYTQVKAHIKNHHPANTTIANGTGLDEKCVSLKDTFTVKEETMIPLLKACFMPQRSGPALSAAKGEAGNGPEHVAATNYQSAFTSVRSNCGRARSRKGVPRKISNGVYKCRRCCITLTTREELLRHRRTTWCAYTWLVVHACPHCAGFTTRFSSVLEKHIARVHNNNE